MIALTMMAMLLLLLLSSSSYNNYYHCCCCCCYYYYCNDDYSYYYYCSYYVHSTRTCLEGKLLDRLSPKKKLTNTVEESTPTNIHPHRCWYNRLIVNLSVLMNTCQWKRWFIEACVQQPPDSAGADGHLIRGRKSQWLLYIAERRVV